VHDTVAIAKEYYNDMLEYQLLRINNSQQLGKKVLIARRDAKKRILESMYDTYTAIEVQRIKLGEEQAIDTLQQKAIDVIDKEKEELENSYRCKRPRVDTGEDEDRDLDIDPDAEIDDEPLVLQSTVEDKMKATLIQLLRDSECDEDFSSFIYEGLFGAFTTSVSDFGKRWSARDEYIQDSIQS